MYRSELSYEKNIKTKTDKKKEIAGNEIRNALNAGLNYDQQKVVENNMGLVGYIIKDYLNTNMEYNDLFQIGSIGLIKAVLTFDEQKNTKFATYAAVCIKNEIRMFLRKESKYGVTASLDKSIHEKHEDSTKDFHEIINSGINYEDIALDNLEKEELKQVIHHFLDTKEKIIVFKYFFENKSQREIAKSLNISQSYVSRLQKEVIKKIKQILNENIYLKPTTLTNKARKK